MSRPPRASLWGIPLDPVDMNQAVQLLVEAVLAHRQGRPQAIRVATVNAEMMVMASRQPELAATLKESQLVVPDGAGVVWALRRAGLPAQKVAGVELLVEFCRALAPLGGRVFLLGAAPGVAEEAALRLKAEAPGLEVVGVRDGFFGPGEEAQVVDLVREARPDFLVVALGVPRQEQWIASHQAALGLPVAMGVGGSLDVLAGRLQRAPDLWRRFQLEWLYRLVQEPWRFKRMASTLPHFVWRALREGVLR